MSKKEKTIPMLNCVWDIFNIVHADNDSYRH